jgi:hypothetical protein
MPLDYPLIRWETEGGAIAAAKDESFRRGHGIEAPKPKTKSRCSTVAESAYRPSAGSYNVQLKNVRGDQERL